MPQLQALQGVPSLAEELGKALGKGVQDTLSSALEGYHKRKQFESLGLDPALSSLDPAIAKEIIKNKQKQSLLDKYMPQAQQQRSPQTTQQMLEGQQQPISEQQIQALSLIDPNLARITQSQQKQQQQRFEAERKYHTEFSKPIEQKVEGIREALPKTEMAARMAREAIESGDVGRFSKNSLATLPFLPDTAKKAFLSAKGAQLTTAGKENLLSNMSRVSSKGQNLWFEQRLNSMFPQIGQSEEANLTIQEMLEGEHALDQAYIDKFDKLASEDMERNGFVKKDIGKRVADEMKPIEKQILDRTSYRLKEIEEQELGEEKLQKKINQKVPQGTPLTVKMGNLLYKKHGEKTLQVAKQLGYKIPTAEEVQLYSLRAEELKGL